MTVVGIESFKPTVMRTNFPNPPESANTHQYGDAVRLKSYLPLPGSSSSSSLLNLHSFERFADIFHESIIDSELFFLPVVLRESHCNKNAEHH